MNDLFEKLLILRTPKIGPVKYAELIRQFGTAAMVCDSLDVSDELRDGVKREMDAAAHMGIHYICDDDVRYPYGLRDVKNHPPIICVRGNIETLSQPTIGMVGTRNASAVGIRFISNMAREFAAREFAVVSGMAMGTDAAAHIGALQANGNANTIAVLAGGADYIWPLENEKLYYDIIERGCVISEMPVGFVPTASNFVQRNRWVAALSDRLILGEADLKSGSTHTARFAIDYKKQVFAIPSHPHDARSVGPNTLISKGMATLCMGINDFFDVEKPNTKNEKRIENNLLDLLGTQSVSESVLADLAKKSVAEIKRDLVVLELGGAIQKTDSGWVKM